MEKEEINIPVTIITGFLGAGKTTFLNHIIQKNKDKRHAIIENEFGEQGVDNELVINADESLISLNNGCLCCTLHDNLYDILNELHDRRDEFDEIIIEATGVADPAGLARPFISHPLIKKHFPLTAIICLVDAELIESQLKETEEAKSQIAFSDILLLNKKDLVSESYLSYLQAELKQINPLAIMTTGSKSQFPNIEFERTNDKLERILANELNHTPDGDASNFPVQKPHSHHHHEHTKEINSISFIFDKPFDFDRLHLQLSIYMTFQSKDLYRMKGLIWLENEDHQFVLQSVQKRFVFSKKRAWSPAEERRTILVFIGKNLRREGLERMLSKCMHSDRLKKNV